MSSYRSNEKSPLLKSVQNDANSSRAYSESSSREEARPYGELQVTDNNNQSAIADQSLYQSALSASFQNRQQHDAASNSRTATPHSPPGRPLNEEGGDTTEDTPLVDKGPFVVCRVCETEISLLGKTNQHVVRCMQCHEVTPIRAAPPGKKYVRCPCNCLLVCKSSSTRIACPRQNCRRVITLAASSPTGTAVRAPPGTCRVQCAHCAEIFMFNSLTNSVANCPHCKKCSSVGSFARSRATLFFIFMTVFFVILIGLIIGTLHSGTSVLKYVGLALVALGLLYLTARFIYYARLKISQILGPI